MFNDNDLEDANALLDEALLELSMTRETLPKILLSYCGIETNQRIALAVQQQWEKGLHVKIELNPQEWTLYYDNLCKGNFLIGGMSWHSRIKDPIYNLQLFTHKEDRLNMSHWEDALFQKLIKEAQSEVDVDKRLDLLAKAESVLMENMPVIPIYFLSVSYVKNPALKDVYVSDINEIDFCYARKETRI